MKKLHVEDKNIIINFIDNVRLRKNENVQLEILARHTAEFLGINPNQSNAKLANKFATLLETNQIA
jgi:hypothetical protein